jgi:NAD(P)-dependent dehydrogenase (short-subunit alcohol dehydrogenase family)
LGRLSGKIALVTGGASVPGLGSATAIRFAQEGATVFVTDLDGAGAQKVAQAICAAGGAATGLMHDVTSQDDWDRVFSAIEAAHGRLDVLVNNAGIAVLKMFAELSWEDWQRQNSVNLDSVFHGTARAVSLMRRTGTQGSIINISSIGGIVGVPACSAYAAAKGGVRMFSRTVAIECARENIRVNSVHPGMIMTNMMGGAQTDNADNYDGLTESIPMGRLGDPDDIANMNLFLASDEARYITGAEFVVDGGMTAQ